MSYPYPIEHHYSIYLIVTLCCIALSPLFSTFTTALTMPQPQLMAVAVKQQQQQQQQQQRGQGRQQQNKSVSQPRVELFFKDNTELRERIVFLQERGIHSYNIVNKNNNEPLKEWVDEIADEAGKHTKNTASSICVHYSLKYNRKGGPDAAYARFHDTLRSLSQYHRNGTSTEVLVVSGSGKKPNSFLDAIDALRRLRDDYNDGDGDHIDKDGGCNQSTMSVERRGKMIPKIAVAFNPFFSDPCDRDRERNRLIAKLDTGMVSKIYLQFGSDLKLLRSSLDWLASLSTEWKSHVDYDDNRCSNTALELCGSIFIPSPKLIAQQKFRPWNGVFLSDDFLSSPQDARRIVLEMIMLYRHYAVELLIEAPGVRNGKDLDLVTALLQDSTASVSVEEGNINVGVDSGEKDEMITLPDLTVVKYDTISSSQHVHSTVSAQQSSSQFISPITHPPKQQQQQQQQSLLSNALQPKFDKPALLLFGSFDVRLNDNQAFESASRHNQIIPAFLWNKAQQGRWGVRGALEVVLKDALRHLDTQLRDNTLQLVCRNTNDCIKEVLDLCHETGAQTVYWNREHTTESRIIETNMKLVLADANISVVESQSSLLYDPENISLSKGFNGGHWGTLMPFLKTCRKQMGEPRRPTSLRDTIAIIESTRGLETWPRSTCVEDLDMAIISGKYRWDTPILHQFPMSEEAARSNLTSFFSRGFHRYEKDRSRADLEQATSLLSTHLRIGTLSPHHLYHKTADSILTYEQKKTFSRRLFWRDLAYYQLYCFPNMRHRSIRSHYESVQWITDKDDDGEATRRFDAWKWGRTGYPIVDAGMRQLYAQGWMTQSVRMVVASFLIEYLRIDWVKGCEWFHYTLVDADSAINAMMWQNAGRSGIDQWNFVMSPETASQDPSGDYTRRWVPELAGLGQGDVHRPWKVKRHVLEDAGVVLGDTYPERIVVDLKGERKRGVESVLRMRCESQAYNNDRGYDLITLPSGEKSVVFTIKDFRIDRQGNVIQTKSKAQARKEDEKQTKVTKFFTQKNRRKARNVS